MLTVEGEKVREAYIKFFVDKKKHDFVQSSPVVPLSDPTLLFANAACHKSFQPFQCHAPKQGLREHSSGWGWHESVQTNLLGTTGAQQPAARCAWLMGLSHFSLLPEFAPLVNFMLVHRLWGLLPIVAAHNDIPSSWTMTGIGQHIVGIHGGRDPEFRGTSKTHWNPQDFNRAWPQSKDIIPAPNT